MSFIVLNWVNISLYLLWMCELKTLKFSLSCVLQPRAPLCWRTAAGSGRRMKRMKMLSKSCRHNGWNTDTIFNTYNYRKCHKCWVWLHITFIRVLKFLLQVTVLSHLTKFNLWSFSSFSRDPNYGRSVLGHRTTSGAPSG